MVNWLEWVTKKRNSDNYALLQPYYKVMRNAREFTTPEVHRHFERSNLKCLFSMQLCRKAKENSQSSSWFPISLPLSLPSPSFSLSLFLSLCPSPSLSLALYEIVRISTYKPPQNWLVQDWAAFFVISKQSVLLQRACHQAINVNVVFMVMDWSVDLSCQPQWDDTSNCCRLHTVYLPCSKSGHLSVVCE